MKNSFRLIPLLACAALLCACTPNIPQETAPPVIITPNVTAPSIEPAAPAYLNPDGMTIRTRFVPPAGFERKPADEYGEYLRDQPVLPHGSPVLQYDGTPVEDQTRHAAVLAIDVGEDDLQQCADAALRLRCEFLYSIQNYQAINYHLTNGDQFPYQKFREGYRLQVEGNETELVQQAQPSNSYETFRQYLDVLFNYASTRSLYPESEQITLEELKIGDLLLVSGAPGHCIVVMDMCENSEGRRAILLGQSSTPAQQIHILQPPDWPSPWLYLDEIEFPFTLSVWDYTEENLRRMP